MAIKPSLHGVSTAVKKFITQDYDVYSIVKVHHVYHAGGTRQISIT